MMTTLPREINPHDPPRSAVRHIVASSRPERMLQAVSFSAPGGMVSARRVSSPEAQ